MIKIDVTLSVKYNSDDIKNAIMQKLPVEKSEIKDFKIIKRELNLSDKSNICYKTTVAVTFDADREAGLLKMKKKVSSRAKAHGANAAFSYVRTNL